MTGFSGMEGRHTRVSTPAGPGGVDAEEAGWLCGAEGPEELGLEGSDLGTLVDDPRLAAEGP